MSKKNVFLNNTENQLLTTHSLSSNINNKKEAISLTANQLFRKQLEISKAVRGIGDSTFKKLN